MKKKKKLRKRIRIILFLFLIGGICFYYFSLNPETREKLLKKPFIITYIIKEQKRQKAINECLARNEVPDVVKESLQDLESDLNNYLANHNIGFKYQEKTLDYELSYRSDAVYYGASLIKIVDANYLLDNDVDLSLTKKYERKHVMAYSSGVSKYKLGDEIPLKDLMNYAVSMSDNSAHLMLIDYIGFTKLQDYGKSLGGKVILQGGDLFGNQTADDMIMYLNKAYELINSKENGHLLKEAMLNTEVNYLNFDDVVFGHKYGSHSVYFHDVGILFSDNPYLIAVLTTSDNNKSVVTEVSKKVYTIHNKLVTEKNNYCKSIE